MQKPNGYDEAQVSGEFTPISLGGHHLIIKGVREEKSKKGQDMIVVAFDTAPNDTQPKYFGELFEKDVRPEKKWPNNGIQYILTMDYENPNATSRNFKTFITCVEKSNGFEVEWGTQNWGDQFKNKKVGGVFGVVEEEYDGKVRKKHRLRWFCEDSKVDPNQIPAEKLLGGKKGGDGFEPMTPTEEELPW